MLLFKNGENMNTITTSSANYVTSLYTPKRELDLLMDFCKSHKKVYIYGKGRISNGLQKYFKNSEIEISGIIDTNDLLKFKENYEQGDTGIVFGMGDKYICEVLPQLLSWVNSKDMYILSIGTRERLGNLYDEEYAINNFVLSINVTTICNLNCKSCLTFAPICKPLFYTPDELRRDLKAVIKALGGPPALPPIFSGGEAFVSPHIFELFSVARELLPDTEIGCYTNGILVSKFDDEKFELLKKLNIKLYITEYPVENLDLSKLYEKLDKHLINYHIIQMDEDKKFTALKFFKERIAKKYEYMNCSHYDGRCRVLMLFKGKVYRCEQAMNHEHLNNAFNTNFELLEDDFLNTSSLSKKDIFNLFSQRINFCDYCSHDLEHVPWGLSERKADEWL